MSAVLQFRPTLATTVFWAIEASAWGPLILQKREVGGLTKDGLRCRLKLILHRREVGGLTDEAGLACRLKLMLRRHDIGWSAITRC